MDKNPSFGAAHRLQSDNGNGLARSRSNPGPPLLTGLSMRGGRFCDAAETCLKPPEIVGLSILTEPDGVLHMYFFNRLGSLQKAGQIPGPYEIGHLSFSAAEQKAPDPIRLVFDQSTGCEPIHCDPFDTYPSGPGHAAKRKASSAAFRISSGVNGLDT